MKSIKQAQEMIKSSPAILISASNGLSIAEGYNIFADDENFRKYFNEFKALYGINGLIQGVFAQIPEADHNVFMSKVHQFLIDDYQPTTVFANLKELVAGKDYFIVTSNADTHFQMNGFDEDKIFEVEGNFDGLDMQTTAWDQQQARFNQFISDHATDNVLQLELGIGAKNQMIKGPLMKLVNDNLSWQYLTMNMPQEINVLPAIASRALALPGDIGENFQQLLAEVK
ncbi:hypothetical protein [Companilactobacillus furfuricola]|uniref:hypothetical protein n=1 Tax=Companilactobacillus furfuricola TaxID=1462575 RepID=UPI000F76CEA9|nr:hypothetical protein [Companilactobacillus furfuricola]